MATCKKCGEENLRWKMTAHWGGWQLYTEDGKVHEHNTPVKCKYCSASNLIWRKTSRGFWVLLETDDNTRHHCEAYRNMEQPTTNTAALKCPEHSDRWVFKNRCIMCEITGGPHAVLEENPDPVPMPASPAIGPDPSLAM